MCDEGVSLCPIDLIKNAQFDQAVKPVIGNRLTLYDQRDYAYSLFDITENIMTRQRHLL